MDIYEFERDLDAAVQEVVRKHEGSFLYKWAIAIDTQPPDGDRGVWIFNTPDLTAWDLKGLLQQGIDLQNAELVKAMMGQSDEDD